MLPNFNSTGNLPKGIHEATITEIEELFTHSLIRKEHFRYLKDLINDLRTIGCKVIYIDGSFVTKKILPKDIDVCWDRTGVDLLVAKRLMPVLWDFSYNRREQQKKYHADVFPADIIEASTGIYFLDFFQVDKNTGAAKGIIKLKI